MDFSEDLNSSKYIIRAYTPGCITINNTEYNQPVVVTPENVTEGFLGSSIDEITPEQIARLCQSGAEVILLGTGEKQEMLPKSLFIEAAKHNKSIDIMNTQAACHTYSILSTDGRRVIAALIP